MMTLYQIKLKNQDAILGAAPNSVVYKTIVLADKLYGNEKAGTSVDDVFFPYRLF